MLIAGALCAAAAVPTLKASAIVWPSAYEGVMLQGFYWDSWEDTKWTNLEAQTDANNAKAFFIKTPGTYDFVFDPANMTLTVSEGSGVETILDGEEGAVTWYNLQGQRVEKPANGIFIRVSEKSVRKVLVK